MNAIDELRGYAALMMDMSSNPGMQVVGKRLGELADQVAKEQQVPRCWCLDDSGQSLCVPGAGPVNHAPAALAAVLLKDLADWWQRNRNKSFSLELHAEIAKLAYRAHCIVHS